MPLENIVGLIGGSVVLFVLLSLLVISFIWGYHIDKRRKEFLLTLNEHELAIIQKYFACSLHPFKKENNE